MCRTGGVGWDDVGRMRGDIAYSGRLVARNSAVAYTLRYGVMLTPDGCQRSGAS